MSLDRSVHKGITTWLGLSSKLAGTGGGIFFSVDIATLAFVTRDVRNDTDRDEDHNGDHYDSSNDHQGII